jgi:hypothetical protein
VNAQNRSPSRADYEAYPVTAGDTWSCGRHVFRCGSALDLTYLRATLIYCDPPFNQAVLRSFQRRAGVTPDGTWQDIYAHIIRLGGDGHIPVFLESGTRQAPEVAAMMPPGSVQWPITWASNLARTCVLHGPDVGDFTGMDDYLTIVFALGFFTPGLVADPCAGFGATAEAAEASGWSSFNVEPDGRRVSAALARMMRLTGEGPRLIPAPEPDPFYSGR